MIKRVLFALLALVVLFYAVRGLVRFLASDETKIRRLVAGMEEAYNAGRPGSCVGPLAKDWRHESYQLDRELLLGALFQVARERDRETHELLTRVTVDEDAATVTVQDERATLALEALFERRRAGAWRETWRVRVEAELADGEDGWQIVKSRHTDLAGTHLGR
jgi:hypothetical protein